MKMIFQFDTDLMPIHRPPLKCERTHTTDLVLSLSLRVLPNSRDGLMSAELNPCILIVIQVPCPHLVWKSVLSMYTRSK